MDKPCFELKGSLFTLSVLQLFGNDLSLLKEQLNKRVQMAPAFFNHTPFVIDLHELSDESHTLDFAALKELLLSLSIIPVGVKGAEQSLHPALEQAGLAILAEATHKKSVETKPVEIDPEPESDSNSEAEAQSEPESEQEETTESNKNPEPAAKPVKIIKRAVRSGQQIYAPGGDLIIIGSVGAGSEILADGNIHVYGTLRGRALAGVRGDNTANIFCNNLQAELCSITGIYLLSDDLPQDKMGTSVQIYLEDEKLQIDSI